MNHRRMTKAVDFDIYPCANISCGYCGLLNQLPTGIIEQQYLSLIIMYQHIDCAAGRSHHTRRMEARETAFKPMSFRSAIIHVLQKDRWLRLYQDIWNSTKWWTDLNVENWNALITKRGRRPISLCQYVYPTVASRTNIIELKNHNFWHAIIITISSCRKCNCHHISLFSTLCNALIRSQYSKFRAKVKGKRTNLTKTSARN